MLELEIDRKRLNYNENSKFKPFGKSFHFMPFGNYAIWEVTTVTTSLCFSLLMKKFYNFFKIKWQLKFELTFWLIFSLG